MAQSEPVPGESLPPPYFESDDRRFRLYQGDCLDLLPRMPAETFDLIFADPPYFLSNDGITCHAGKMVSVNKGAWDKSRGPEANHAFNLRWLAECRRLLRPQGTLWVSGTLHIIHSVGYAMQQLGFKILNDITWVKPNPPPNLSCRYFTHATETILWARRDAKARHKFHYALMKRLNRGKQMKSVWEIEAPRRDEKVFGKHPTQKPVALLERIIAASSDENDLVLDPFSGSGTTGIAAARARRAFTGIERDGAFVGLTVRRFVGVPQADSPDRLLALLTAHSDAHPDETSLSRMLGITPRQIRYYRQAAAVLGLLGHQAPAWELTQARRRVCSSAHGAARVALAEAMLDNNLVRAAVWAIRRKPSREPPCRAIARLLRACTALSASTSLRRARTLLCWIHWAQTQRRAPPGGPLAQPLLPYPPLLLQSLDAQNT